MPKRRTAVNNLDIKTRSNVSVDKRSKHPSLVYDPVSFTKKYITTEFSSAGFYHTNSADSFLKIELIEPRHNIFDMCKTIEHSFYKISEDGFQHIIVFRKIPFDMYKWESPKCRKIL